jgi:transposase InsO family protein
VDLVHLTLNYLHYYHYGPFGPPHYLSSYLTGHHRWILTATDHFTKWIEVIPTRSASHKVIIGFLEDIMARFGCLNIIITDNVVSFKYEPLIKFCEQFGISLIHSTPYYPQGNGLIESSNKSIIKIIKRLLEDNKKAWDSKLKFALWADRVKNKEVSGCFSFSTCVWS